MHIRGQLRLWFHKRMSTQIIRGHTRGGHHTGRSLIVFAFIAFDTAVTASKAGAGWTKLNV